jgi:hypothetical protein
MDKIEHELKLTQRQMTLLRRIMTNAKGDRDESGYNADGSVATVEDEAEFEELLQIIRKG